MAGISIIKNNGGLLNRKEEISKVLDSINFQKEYKSEIFLNTDSIFIGLNKYNEYPVSTLETDAYTIYIEGRIYNKPDAVLKKELPEIFDNLSDNVLKNWLLNADGDFIIYAYNKKKNALYVLNDILGRLPLYYKKINDGIIISRYFRFITGVEGSHEFDKTGIGEFLLLSYLLGERTLFKNISQLRPASLITADDKGVSVKIIHDFDFQNRKYERKDFNEIISDLSGLLSQSCINRFNNGNTNLIALSSGLDSRTVAACMAANKIPFKTTTMVFKNGAAKVEIEYARQVAQLFGAEWNPMDIYPPDGHDILSLLKAKEGMNFLATAFILPFYRQIRKEYGNNVNFITGDKTDKVTLSYDNPIDKFANRGELINYILGEHSMVNIDEVCSLVDIKKDDILNDFDNLLKTYPETDLSQGYIHFRAIEKSHKLAFHGDDRHKRFIWSYCPLTSGPFVSYLFNCSNKSKKMHRLFIALLNSYSPAAAKIEYPNFKAPITSLKAKVFMASVYYLYPRVSYKMRGMIKNLFFGDNPVINTDSIFYKCIDEQLKQTPGIQEYFKISDASQLKNYRMTMLQSIFTITSLIEDFNDSNEILIKYSNEEFDHMKL